MTEENNNIESTEPEAPETAEEVEVKSASDVEPEVAAPESAEPEELEATEPARVEPRRQTVVLRSGSCDMRVGQDVNDLLGQVLKQFSGNPRRTLMVSGPEVLPELVENSRRSLVNMGYDVRQLEAPADNKARTLEFATTLQAALAKEQITADDPVVVIGDADLISGALYVTSTWYGGCILAAVPTTLDGMVEIAATPRALDTPGAQDALLGRGNVRLMLCDIDNLPKFAPGEKPDAATLNGRAVLAAGALVSNKAAFSDFGIALDKFLENDPATLTKTIMDIAKARGRVVAATAIAQRQGVLYGVGIARALRQCIDAQQVDPERYLVDEPCDGELLAEGIRIAARLGAAVKPDKPELVDLVFAQDGMLDKLGLKEVACVIEPEALLAAMKEVEYTRQNRFMLAIPADYGRVRLTTIDDELLAEHIGAWCKARRKLARRRAKEAQQNN